MADSPMHLAAILVHGPSPHTIGQWRLPRSFRGFNFSEPAYWEHLARVLERGKFDMLFLADSYSLPDRYQESSDATIRHAVQYPHHDPLPLLPVMSRVTTHLGVAATVSTTFLPPYWTARTFATLDHITEGRVAWNVVTSYGRSEARCFGLEDIPDHDERYDRAEEYINLCKELWSSWDADAVVFDRENGIFADPSKVRPVSHTGKWFTCNGPLHVTPSPQGGPVIIQAGASPKGLAFAARHAEVHFAVRHGAENMRAYRAALDEQIIAEGREPKDVKVLWGILPVVGESSAEARAKDEAIRNNVSVEGGLVQLSSTLNFDLSVFPTDVPLRDLDLSGIKAAGGIQGTLTAHYERNSTLADVAREVGSGIGPHIVGTATEVADQLEELNDAAGDGFMLFTHTLPGSLEDFVDLVVPELQARGLYRTEYGSRIMRERLAS